MFYSPHGLESWEIVVASGLFALGLLAVFILTGFVLAVTLIRDRCALPVRVEQSAPGNVETKPIPARLNAESEYAAVSA